MYFRNSTQIPNKLFDIHLKALSVKELKVLLIVIRQTIGWVDSKGERKKRDWMSQKFFANKTGLSPKSVSQAISMLVSKQFIIATSQNGTELWYASERKGKERIYYGPSQKLVTFLPKPYVKSTQDPSTKGNTTKLTYTKERTERLTNYRHSNDGYQRINKVMERKNGFNSESGE